MRLAAGVLLHRAFYVLQLASMAALLPLLGGRFEAAGFDGVTIGLLMGMLPAGRLLAAPLWAYVADRHRIAGLVLRASALGSALAGMVLARSESVGALAIALFCFSAIRAPIGAVLDSFVLRALHDAGRPAQDYGRIRLWGSLGFVVGVLAAGAWDRVGLPPHLLADATLLGSAALAFLYPWRGQGGPAPILPALRELAAQPFLVPLLLTGALQALTISVYDTFYSVHVAALGLPSWVVGASVAAGVVCEVAVMAAGRPLLLRLGPARGMLLAAASGVPRWLVTAWAPDPALLIAAQALHGVGFGVFWLSGVQRMAQASRAEIGASAQSLWAASTYGAGALVGAALAGVARRSLGSAGIFLVLTAVSALATLTAVWFARRDRAAG